MPEPYSQAELTGTIPPTRYLKNGWLQFKLMLSRASNVARSSSFASASVCARKAMRPPRSNLHRVHYFSYDSSSSKRGDNALVETMNLFDDFKEAVRLQKSGHFNNSLTYFDRVLQIISSYKSSTTSGSSGSSGSSLPSFQQSDLLFYTLNSYNTSLLKSGNTTKSIQLLKYHLPSFDNHALNKVKLLHLISRSMLLNKNLDDAIKNINDSIIICENHSNDIKTSDSFTLNYLVDCYNLKGVILLLHGDYEESEMFFQNSYRFSNYVHNTDDASVATVEGITSAIKSGNNFGSFFWHKKEHLGDKAIESVDMLNLKAIQESLRAADFLVDFSTTTNTVDKKLAANLKESMYIWESVYGEINSSANKAVETNQVNSCSNPVVTSSITGKGIDVGILSSNASFVASYAHLLCNLSEGYNLIDYLELSTADKIDSNADKDSKQEQKSVSKLSEALKVVDTYEQNGGLSTPYTGSDEVRQAKERVLSLLGHVYSGKLQAVTAEGLYRSVSTEKFLVPDIGGSDGGLLNGYGPQEMYNIALTLYRYGNLLKKWEKRETNGATLTTRARELWGVAVHKGAHKGAHLNHFIRS